MLTPRSRRRSSINFPDFLSLVGSVVQQIEAGHRARFDVRFDPTLLLVEDVFLRQVLVPRSDHALHLPRSEVEELLS